MNIGVVRTNYGDVFGVGKPGYTVFRSIPYAKPPIGPLRFRKPLPPESWKGVLHANSFKSRSMQVDRAPGSFNHIEFFQDDDYITPISEDSLYLNIWTPASKAFSDEKLPVAFWIHGGVFIRGFGSEIQFDGGEYCRRGVILVTINYRLGAFGLLAHKWLSEEGGGYSGNYGVYDQLAALEWVRENIEGFGGDPDRITIFGQSAGARSVQAIVSSGLSQGMVAGAIMQSAGGYRVGLRSQPLLDEAETIGEEFVRRCGVASLTELRELPAGVLLAHSEAFHNDNESTRAVHSICADGQLLISDFDSLADLGRHHDIPYLLGSTADDIGVREGVSPLHNGCIGWSFKNEELGRNPAYVYRFNRALSGDNSGAFHSSELWYMFGTLHRSWRHKTSKDYELSGLMLDYWCNFIKTSDPNSPGLPEWRPCRSSDPFIMEFC